ncbi:MAG: carbon starvation protein A [Proteobacteria bacterium]|nr:carbon starvation protein A [Pseudomonadota bacterium]
MTERLPKGFYLGVRKPCIPGVLCPCQTIFVPRAFYFRGFLRHPFAMSALPLMIAVLCVLALAYRYYSAFLAARVCMLNDANQTPAFSQQDGHNYHPTPKWVLFGHHFAAISGAGPLIGPVLAAQFGYLPGLLWLLIGVVIAGATQDFIVLVASVRHQGKSLAQIVKAELGPQAGIAAGLAVLFVLIIALARLGLVVVNALSESSWGTFTIAMTVPIAFLMGLYAYKIRPGRIGEATVFGVIALLLAVVIGGKIPGSPWQSVFSLTKDQLTLAMMTYGFLASVLPVWLLLCPRDYLSSFLKIGTIGLLVIAVIAVNPLLKIPPLTPFIHGGGPIVPGKVFPFVFITIMCGAVSGFHALVSSGTTPKMVMRESHCRSIGYGAMLIEGLVGIVALIAVSSLSPGDYFAINVSQDKQVELSVMGYHIEELPVLEAEVKEKVQGRTGGAVSLAVGMAKILSSIPGLNGFLSYWYHFCIMFEALFILTTIDTGTRIARFVLQEFLGRMDRRFEKSDWMLGTVITSLITVCSWGYFIFTGSIATIWPMFGIANQLLAVIALGTGALMIRKWGRGSLSWVAWVPMGFVLMTTTTGAWQLARDVFLRWIDSTDPSLVIRGAVDLALTTTLFTCLGVIGFRSLRAISLKR